MKIHALTCDNSGNCQVVLHTPIPSGNNAVGQSWKSVWMAAGRNVSSLVEGIGLGQIGAAELASVVAGDVMEIADTIPITVVAGGAAAVNAMGDVLIASAKATFQQQLNYFGWTSVA